MLAWALRVSLARALRGSLGWALRGSRKPCWFAQEELTDLIQQAVDDGADGRARASSDGCRVGVFRCDMLALTDSESSYTLSLKAGAATVIVRACAS